jgi:hypothetical protein
MLKPELIKIIQSQTNTKVKLQNIYFNPFIFKIKLNNLELLDMQKKHLISFDFLMLDVEPHSLIKSAIHVKTLLLSEPKISVIYTKDKIINLSKIIKETKEEKPKKENSSKFEIPRIIIDRVALVDGSLNYEDFSKKSKFEFGFKDIGFELKDVDTSKLKSKDATLKFYTTLQDGGFLDLKGKITSFEPFIIKGDIDFEASKLYTEYRYMQDDLKLEVADGKIDFDASYYFNLDKPKDTTITISDASISKLRIKPKKAHKDILNLKNLTIKDATIKPMIQSVHLASLDLDTLNIKAKRDRRKNIDWIGYTKQKPSKKVKKSSKKTTKTKPWDVVVDKVSLKKIALAFDDRGVSPRVKTKLNTLNIYLKNVTLAGKKPLNYKMDFKLNNRFVCNSSGDILHSTLDINSYTKCSGLDIVKFRPYIDEIARDSLSVYDVKLKRATLGFDAKVKVKEKNKQMQISVKNANIKLDRVALDKRSTKERLVDFRRFSVNGVDADTLKKDVKIKKVTLKSLNIQTALNKDGTINMDKLIVAKKSKNRKKTHRRKTKKTKPYRVRIKEFALKSSKLNFNDMSLKPSLKTKVDGIYANIYNIDSKKRTWLRYYLSMRLNSKGYIKSKGKLRHTPLKNVGSLNIDKISLKEFSPYIEKDTFLKLDDGYINLKSKILYAKNTLDADLKVHGDLNVEEFFLNDTKDNSTLLSFNDMTLNAFDFEKSPDRAFVNELDIDGFYLNAVIDKKKVINFAKLSRTKKVDAQTPKKIKKTNDTNSTQFPFKIMKLKVSSGSAKFADLSLPIEFRTDIHDLNGVIYSITNAKNEVSYIDIAGEIDKYGSTKLKGNIDASNPKSYTDLNLNFRNLSLNSLSGYSASFAGYKIDEGKLFLDLGYEIVDSKLLGKNSIIIKKIKLGDEIKDENASSLPLGLAIALLEDGDGIIDIDMPVEGNVDAPDFKYGALLWKTFGNLILKAVASPFKFLGSMMGIKGDDLEYVEFEKGSSVILPPEREKLDKIVKLMVKRPKIKLAITPQYDEVQDVEMLKKDKLTKLIMKRSGIKNAKEHQNIMNVALLEDIYNSMSLKKKTSTIKEELAKKYKGEILNRYYQNALFDELVKVQKVSKLELDALALKRATQIKDYLIYSGSILDKRIEIKKVDALMQDKENWVKTKLEVVIK